MIESIEKLRRYISEMAKGGLGNDARNIDFIIGDIESEIEGKIDDLMATSVDGYPEPFNTPDAMHMVLGTAVDCFDTPQEAVLYLRGETSMLLPVDADGVPIRIGDDVTWLNGTPSSKFTIDTFAFDMEHGEWDVKDSNFLNVFPAHRCRHVKPRTIEDVLREFRFDANLVYGDPNIGGEDRADELSALDAKYADELRGMGVER